MIKVLAEVLDKLVNIASMTQIRRTPDISNFTHIIEAALKRDVEEAKYWIQTDISDI